MTRRIACLAASLFAIAVIGCGGRAPTSEQAVAPATTSKSSTPPAESVVLAGATGKAPAATKEITFDDIKLEMQKGDPYDSSKLTSKVKDLDGKPVRIRGYILPSFYRTGIKQFVLVRDNLECCFGPGALLHDCVLVEMQGDATATFTVRPVSAEGVFSIREVKGPDGQHLAIYHLDGTQVH